MIYRQILACLSLLILIPLSAKAFPPASPAGGNYLVLDGVDDYAVLDFKTFGVLFPKDTDEFTVEAWVYPTTPPAESTYAMILSQQVEMRAVSDNEGWYDIKKRKIGPRHGYDVKELPTVEMYDPVTDMWTQKTNMPTARSTHTCAVDGKIYAIGGAAFNNIRKKKPWRLDLVEVYDPATDTWAKAKSMNHARDSFAVSVVDGKIYVMGGTGWPQIPFHPGPFLSVVEVFNPKTNQWREIGDMPAAKSSHTASVIICDRWIFSGQRTGYERF